MKPMVIDEQAGLKISNFYCERSEGWNQGVQKKDTILSLALNLAGKSIFTPPRFFLAAVTQLPYKKFWGEGGVQNLRNFFEKCSER